MTLDKPSRGHTKQCPTCGTRVSEDANRCLVCGTDLGKSDSSGKPSRAIGRARMPEVTLSLPVIVLLFAAFLLIGGGLTYYGVTTVLAQDTEVPEATVTQTPTPTLTPTPSTPTPTHTPAPTLTPLTYTVKAGETCSIIAATFGVSVNSIILENNLSAECFVSGGQVLKIPQPTPTASPVASPTLSGQEATIQACETETYLVQEGESLSVIAQAYGISEQSIMSWNGMTTSNVFAGQTLTIPLCETVFIFGVGTVTPSPAPPYSAPQLLLPADGAPFTLEDDNVVLQWSSVGTLRENEAYQVTIIDITSGGEIMLVDEVRDTKYVVPTSMRPTESSAHAFRWFVVPVAQVGVDEDGNPVWRAGGAVSETRIFIWSGGVPAASTPAPE